MQQRQEEADAQARQDALDKAQRNKDALAAQVTNAQLGEITRKNTAEDAATKRTNEGIASLADSLKNVQSGNYNNPDTQIADPELEKEKAITANYGPILAMANNRVGPQQPGGNTAANKNLLDTVGNAGLESVKKAVMNRSPAEYLRGNVGQYADVPAVKETMSDLEKQEELKTTQAATAAQKEADRLQKEKDLQAGFENQKTLKTMEIKG